MTARSDNFNRANGPVGTPSDSGDPWGMSSGADIQTFANGCVSQSGGSNEICWLDSETPYVEVGATIFVVLNLNRLIVRRVADDTYIFLQVEATLMSLYRRTGGSNTLLDQQTGLSIGDGDDITLEADSDDNIRGYLNGVLQVSATDSQGNTETEHGLGFHTGVLAEGWDDYFSNDLAPPTPTTTRKNLLLLGVG